MGAELFHADRQTDRWAYRHDEAFRNFANAPKTGHLMLYREIIAVCSEIHTKHINTLCGQNVELLSVTVTGTYSDRWALEGIVKDSVPTAQ
jgi:hypothetical protein